MKFLKKNVTEANAVAAVVEKTALSHSEVAFTFFRDNKKTIVTSGDGNLRNCIYSVLGKDFTMNTVPVDYELDGVKVKGFVTKPQAARGSREGDDEIIRKNRQNEENHTDHRNAGNHCRSDFL